jgi:hypothetical protein
MVGMIIAKYKILSIYWNIYQFVIVFDIAWIKDYLFFKSVNYKKIDMRIINISNKKILSIWMLAICIAMAQDSIAPV